MKIPAKSYDDRFVSRHIGPRPSDVQAMLAELGYETMDEFIDAVVPEHIRMRSELDLPPARSEEEVLDELSGMSSRNAVNRSYIGMGYHDCVTPSVIRRNILENPGWYTAYTPYQPEIAQGRLEALLNFQTMVADLTGLEIANASLLDEATAAAEAMSMTFAVIRSKDADTFLVDENCHPQTVAVVRTRAEARGIRVNVGDPASFSFDDSVAGVLLQYPGTDGRVTDYMSLCEAAHRSGALVTVATDLMALALLKPPGEWGADIAVGSSQRFGVPLGYGGPHAAFFATREEHRRSVPGRIIGVSRDSRGRMALRMALQTREQHIRRDKATSNICTAQVLLAVIAGMFGVYHGPEGIRRIARRILGLTTALATGLQRLGYGVAHESVFDTVCAVGDRERLDRVMAEGYARGVNLRRLTEEAITASLDETTDEDAVAELLSVFALGKEVPFTVQDLAGSPEESGIPQQLRRTSEFMTHPVFHRFRSETEMLRYLKRLENRDLSLTSAMIPLGSCTMKLNATTEMLPITWPGFAALHPFAPVDQADGYSELFQRLERQLRAITGFQTISLQPNAGSQGEFTGLLVIRALHLARGDEARNVCLIPTSAHGTNPASAVMAGMKVITVKTDEDGNIDVEDLEKKAEANSDTLAALMVTYPSTHGVFEARITEVCDIIHAHGGRVYMDGANMNAQVGLCRPADIGADVCHLNLHKTFCIPHGGGGPGMGPIGVTEELAPFLPDHPVVRMGGDQACGTVSAAPWGSPSILPISWAYIAMMGPDGVLEATRVAILAANYVAHRLAGHYDLLYAGKNGLIAHECILDTRPFKQSAGIEVEDIAKRLIDYGFHPPTISFPVPGTMMVEPTESESLEELDRFCDAMIAIRSEIREVETGETDREDNVLKRAPHTLVELADDWDRPYSREKAAFPTPQTKEGKIFPYVGRVDAAYGDRNLVCSCPPIEEYEVAATPS